MNLIGLASTTYLENGAVMLLMSDDPGQRSGARRISRTKTLDGGVSISDSGFSDGDRTLMLRMQTTETLWARLWTLFCNAPALTLTCDEGCFLAAARNLTEKKGTITMEIYFNRKLA